MKYAFFFLLIFVIILSGCLNSRVKEDSIKKKFKQQFEILDEAASSSEYDTLTCDRCPAAIEFMILNTHIDAVGDGTPHGILFFSKADLAKWHEYYESKYVRVKKSRQ